MAAGKRQIAQAKVVAHRRLGTVNPQDLNRRDFNRLSIAALSGALAGAVAGCGGSPDAPPAGSDGKPGGAEVPMPVAARTGAKSGANGNVTAAELHACRGLNACKGQGKSGANECAGQGDCASPATLHECAGQNACNGQGGCGEKPTQNSCKSQGLCKVPLMEEAWEKARKHFEETMNKSGKEFGAAPKA
jgi:hypothetical protein